MQTTQYENSTIKTKMSLRGNDPTRTTVIIFNDQIKEQMSHLNYLRIDTDCDMNYDIGLDIKLGMFHTVCGTTDCIKAMYSDRHIYISMAYGTVLWRVMDDN